jgi:hypothetical protein
MMKTFKLHSPHQTCGWPKPWVSRDYWVAHTLGEALTDAGGRAVYGDSDIDVYLWGCVNEPVNQEHTNVLWIIGNPKGLISLLVKQPRLVKAAFNHVFCASARFGDRLKKEYDIDAKWLVCPSPPRIATNLKIAERYEMAFAGNADPAKGRLVLASVLSNHNSVVWGEGWGGLLPGSVWRGEYIHWKNLGRVWDSAKIVPYSAHQDMQQEGFVADSCLDTMVNSSALVLPAKNPGFLELGIETPQWETEEELESLAGYYLQNESQRKHMASEQKRMAGKFNYAHVAREIFSCLEHEQ